MLSLIHSKNISSPTFKVNDSLTQNSIILSPKNPTIQQYKNRPNPIFTIDTKTASPSPNMSMITQVTPSKMLTSSDDKPIFSLPSPKNPLQGPVISISNLYSPKGVHSPLSHSRSASTIPPITLKNYKSIGPHYMNISSADVSPNASPGQSCNTTAASVLKKKPSKPIIKHEESKQHKFTQYLDYLGALYVKNPKENKFEKRLKGKNAEKNEKSVTGSRLDGSTILKLPSYFAGVSSTMLLNSKSTSQLQLNNQASHNSRKSSIFQLKKQPSARVLKNNSRSESQPPSLSEVKEVSTPTSQQQHKKSAIGATYKAHIFGLIKHAPKVVRLSEHDHLFRELTIHLQELYQITGNDQKMATVLEKLSDYNPKVTNIILPKFHKVNDYDANKLEQKFAMIEVVTESLSIPVKLQKKKDGITLIEPSVMEEISSLNKKIEEYNIFKRNERLKVMEDRILQSQFKLQELHHRKYEASKRMGNRMPTDDISVNKITSNVSQDDDPLLAIEEFQRVHGEFKHLNRRNMEHARKVNEVFSKWVQGNPQFF